MRRVRPLFIISLLCASLVGAAVIADTVGGNVQWMLSTGQAKSSRIPPVCLSLPNSVKCTTETMTTTAVGRTGTGTDTSTGTITRTLAKVTVADTDFNGSTATSVSTYTVVTPNATKTYTSTLTLAKTDFCSTTGTNGGIPCAGTNSKIDISWLPDLSGTYQTTAGMTAYQTTAGMTNYATTTDTRLSDARTPTGNVYGDGNIAWKTGTSTATGTSAALAASPVATLVNVPDTVLTMGTGTHANVSTTAHGLQPALPGDPSVYLNGNGAYTTPAAAVTWSNGYEVDFTSLTTQNLLTGGDGQKTLSDGHTLYIYNSAKSSTFAVTNGTGLEIHVNTTGGSQWSMTAPMVYLRVEEQGTGALAKHLWKQVRVVYIMGTMYLPTNGSYGVSIGGWIGQTTGSSTNSISTFATPGTNNTIRAQVELGYPVSSAREGMFAFGGLASNSAWRLSDTGNAISGSAQDLIVWMTDGGRISTFLGRSNSGAFPADIDGAVQHVGSVPASVSTLTAMDSIAAYVTLSSGSSVPNNDVIIKKLRLEYQ